MIKLTNLLKEATGQKYEYGCVMLYFSFPEIYKIHNKIDPEHIYTEEEDRTYGLEDEPHTTLLFGLHSDVETEDVEKVLNKYTYSTCKIHNASLFENPNYDVLKFDVEGENLHKTNDSLKQYPYTSDFPNYHPHLTIGYLNPGTGKKYVEMLKDMEYELVPNYAVYSKPDGEKVKIKINID
jgi:2'-5' RNA ligase